jgi:hypothetical protein
MSMRILEFTIWFLAILGNKRVNSIYKTLKSRDIYPIVLRSEIYLSINISKVY